MHKRPLKPYANTYGQRNIAKLYFEERARYLMHSSDGEYAMVSGCECRKIDVLAEDSKKICKRVFIPSCPIFRFTVQQR